MILVAKPLAGSCQNSQGKGVRAGLLPPGGRATAARVEGLPHTNPAHTAAHRIPTAQEDRFYYYFRWENGGSERNDLPKIL